MLDLQQFNASARVALPSSGRPQRSCLVVLGGGYRGCVTAGTLDSLAVSGVQADGFTNVFGTSAGAFNAAYFCAGQASKGLAVYVDGLLQIGAISSLRCRMEPLVNVDTVLAAMASHSEDERKSLDTASVIACGRLRIVVRTMTSLRATVLDPPQSAAELWSQLATAAYLPVITRSTARIANLCDALGPPPLSEIRRVASPTRILYVANSSGQAERLRRRFAAAGGRRQRLEVWISDPGHAQVGRLHADAALLKATYRSGFEASWRRVQ